MADGALKITLDTDISGKIAEKARLLGVTPEALAIQVIRDEFIGDHSRDDPRHDHISSYDLNEVGRDWSDVRPELLARMKRKLAEQP